MKIRLATHSLGCKVNSYESMKMEEELCRVGFELVDFGEEADVYLINTCTVTNVADRKSRQMLHKAKKLNPNAIVIACGCYVETGKETLLKDSKVDILVGNEDKGNILPILKTELAARGFDLTQSIDLEDNYYKSNRGRMFLKVQDGCDRYCSYCLIPYARPNKSSKPLIDAINEAESFAVEGYKEIVLTGIHLSSYGMDIDSSLIELVKKISEIDGVERVRLGSLEPNIITDEFLKELTKIKEFCPHFHLSLQSGSNTVLKRMNRHYSAEEYYNKCIKIREYFKHPALTTDVIVGFPQETDEEFMETYDFLNSLSLFESHIFIYSKRDGTRAAKMPGQVAGNIQKERSQRLIELADRKRNEFISYYLGKEDEVLVEELLQLERNSYYKGYSKEYVPIYIKESNNLDLTNELIRVKIKERLFDGLLGEQILN